MKGKLVEKGRLYTNKRRSIFVASDKVGQCPTINFSNSSEHAKMRDDFSKGLKTKRSFAKLMFR
jgi:hypothetical protein